MVLKSHQYTPKDLSENCVAEIEKKEKELEQIPRGKKLMETLVEMDTAFEVHKKYIDEKLGGEEGFLEEIDSPLVLEHPELSLLGN